MVDPGAADPGAADLGALAALAAEAATRAGALLLEGWDRPRASVVSKSTPTDLVTEMDRAAEAAVVEVLLASRPDDGVLGEEGGRRAGTSGVRWVVDPLDGTTNYLYGQPAFAVSVAAEVDGRVAIGCVRDPARGETFSAVAGRGAFRDGVRLAVRPGPELALALVGTGFAYDAATRAEQARALATVLPAVRDVRRVGAAALDLCWVACGRLDGYFERGLQPWDLAAGALVAAEAGAVVTALDGGPAVAPGLVVAAGPALAGPLRDLLRRAGGGGPTAPAPGAPPGRAPGSV